MLFYPLASLLGLTALLAPTALAFDSISTPGTVTAGEPFNVTLVSSDFDAGFDNFVVYLAINPPGWGINPQCTLIKSLPITTTDFSVTLPTNIGPDGSFYFISIMERNSDPNKDGPSGFEYSDAFDLEGGTGVWSHAELDSGDDNYGTDPDLVPCSAYNCVRQCFDKGEDCSLKCPGVQKPEDLGGDGAPASTTVAVGSTDAAGATTTSTLVASGSASTASTSGASETTTRTALSTSAAASTGSSGGSGAGSSMASSAAAATKSAGTATSLGQLGHLTLAGGFLTMLASMIYVL